MPKTTLEPHDVVLAASNLFRRRFSRAEWNSHPDRPVSGSTVHNWFGSWDAFLDQIDFETTRVGEYSEWSQENFPDGVTRNQWDQHPDRPTYSDTIQRDVGWNEFLKLTYGSSARISPNASDDDVRGWIKNATDRDGECWISPSTGPGGYGRVTRNGKARGLHIVSHELFNGPIPDGHVVRHTCDNPACCNPEHLITGTRSDNAKDYSHRNIWGRKPKIKRPMGLSESQLVEWLLEMAITNGDCKFHHSPHPISGYGTTRINGVMWQAHRFVRCQLDELPKDHPMVVRHTCGNRSCINPDHLVWGTIQENRLDDVKAGKNVKITPEKRREIREAWNRWGGTKSEFDRREAIRYGVSEGTIRNVRLSQP